MTIKRKNAPKSYNLGAKKCLFWVLKTLYQLDNRICFNLKRKSRYHCFLHGSGLSIQE
jgi:hypothetical protein